MFDSLDILGEFLNFFLLILQFYLTDNFLNNKFRWFGWEVVEYYSWSFRDRQNRDLMLRQGSQISAESNTNRVLVSETLCALYSLRKYPVTYPTWVRPETSRPTMVCVS